MSVTATILSLCSWVYVNALSYIWYLNSSPATVLSPFNSHPMDTASASTTFGPFLHVLPLNSVWFPVSTQDSSHGIWKTVGWLWLSGILHLHDAADCVRRLPVCHEGLPLLGEAKTAQACCRKPGSWNHQRLTTDERASLCADMDGYFFSCCRCASTITD